MKDISSYCEVIQIEITPHDAQQWKFGLQKTTCIHLPSGRLFALQECMRESTGTSDSTKMQCFWGAKPFYVVCLPHSPPASKIIMLRVCMHAYIFPLVSIYEMAVPYFVSFIFLIF